MNPLVRLEDGSVTSVAMEEFLDELLVQATARVAGGREQPELEIEQALSVAGKVDELAAKLEELDVRMMRLEAEAAL